MSGLKSAARTELAVVIALAALILALVLLPGGVQAATVETGVSELGAQTQSDWGQMPLYFVANQGQVDGAVTFYIPGKDKTLYFTPQGLTFALTGTSGAAETSGRPIRAPPAPPAPSRPPTAGPSNSTTWGRTSSRHAAPIRPTPCSRTSPARPRTGSPECLPMAPWCIRACGAASMSPIQAPRTS